MNAPCLTRPIPWLWTCGVCGGLLVHEYEHHSAPLVHFPEPGVQGEAEMGSGLGGRPLLSWHL